MKTLTLTIRQARYDLRTFWRNPAAAFFTFVFPIMFLVIFNLVFGDQEIEVAGGDVDSSTFYVPGIIALSVISACYTNMAMTMTMLRDRGILKRLRGTPLPTSAFLGGRIIQAIVVSLILVAIVVGIGIVFYGVDAPTDRMPAFLLTLIVSSGAFCALGLAVAAKIPNEDAAPALVQASILPLLFISNIFIPTANAPQWLNDFASLFPVVHASDALFATFDPFRTDSGFEPKDVAIVAAWGVAGALFAARYFTWEPRR